MGQLKDFSGNTEDYKDKSAPVTEKVAGLDMEFETQDWEDYS